MRETTFPYFIKVPTITNSVIKITLPAWRVFIINFSRPLFTIIFRPKMVFLVTDSILRVKPMYEWISQVRRVNADPTETQTYKSTSFYYVLENLVWTKRFHCWSDQISIFGFENSIMANRYKLHSCEPHDRTLLPSPVRIWLSYCTLYRRYCRMHMHYLLYSIYGPWLSRPFQDEIISALVYK